MILSKKFIKDYIDIDDIDIIKIANDMTSVGNEYDYAGKYITATNLVIGKIVKCDKVEDSDHLHICKVDIKSDVIDIVCGALNAREGIKVIVALPGAILPDKTIKKGTICGYESNGMLCSLSEIGIDTKYLKEEEINGICELDEEAPLGEDPIKYLELDDEIIDFELTANRGDLLSIYGMAYELAAIYNRKVNDVIVDYPKSKDMLTNFKLDVKTDKCKMFNIKMASNVIIKDSPLFIKNRLMSCGIRPINNVVDISNYVMLELGCPLHFYDADKLNNNIEVNIANNNDKVITLDEEERILDDNDIVIKSNNNIIGIAGVMGGLNSEITSSTKNVIIEAAIFDNTSVRLTSKKVVRSEASNRFEKGIDPKRVVIALERACYLLNKYASCEISKDTISYNKTEDKDNIIEIKVKDINDVLGTTISKEEVIDIFNRLGFITNNKDNIIVVKVPSRRLDISIKEDLIEEVGRIYGINNIESRLPILPIKTGSYNKYKRDLKNKLVGLSLNEVLTTIFTDREKENMFDNNNEVVMLLDPLSKNKEALRKSLLISLLNVFDYNKDHNNKDISIFEIAKVFYKDGDNYKECEKLAILMHGNYYEEVGNNKKIDFYVIKGIMEEILHFLSLDGRYNLSKDNINKDMHPGMSANINIFSDNIGFIGRIHPSISKDDIYVLELNLDKIKEIKTSKMKYKPLNKYPSIKKDMAFIFNKDIIAEDVIKTISKTGGRKVTDVSIFDIYKSDTLKDKISLGFTLTFEDYDKTLTSEEVNTIFEKVIKEVENKYKGELRNN